ncbi:MAG TPA: hypothetical protein VMS30_11345, partial [Phycisphaerales bacterium]|nr:hypothetical protein [Phycisphaerales bacterium]
MHRILSALVLSTGFGLVAPPARADAPVGTAFTYQGQLKINGVAVNGVVDFEIRLYDAPSGDIQIGPTVTLNGMGLTDGLLTAQLDFGTNVFQGSQRWLQLSLRTPAGSGSYVTLAPRQPLTAAPYALYALNGTT